MWKLSFETSKIFNNPYERSLEARDLGDDMSEFLDVFSDKVSGLPQVSVVKFTIDIISRAEPICKVLFRIGPAKLVEVKR